MAKIKGETVINHRHGWAIAISLPAPPPPISRVSPVRAQRRGMKPWPESSAPGPGRPSPSLPGSRRLLRGPKTGGTVAWGERGAGPAAASVPAARRERGAWGPAGRELPGAEGSGAGLWRGSALPRRPAERGPQAGRTVGSGAAWPGLARGRRGPAGAGGKGRAGRGGGGGLPRPLLPQRPAGPRRWPRLGGAAAAAPVSASGNRRRRHRKHGGPAREARGGRAATIESRRRPRLEIPTIEFPRRAPALAPPPPGGFQPRGPSRGDDRAPLPGPGREGAPRGPPGAQAAARSNAAFRPRPSAAVGGPLGPSPAPPFRLTRASSASSELRASPGGGFRLNEGHARGVRGG